LSSVNGSAIKRITGWRECLPLVFPPGSIRRPAFTLLYRPVSTEKRTLASTGSLPLVYSEHWPVFRHLGAKPEKIIVDDQAANPNS
jgi:hypothetical protein